jgi:hypothetical protein
MPSPPKKSPSACPGPPSRAGCHSADQELDESDVTGLDDLHALRDLLQAHHVADVKASGGAGGAAVGFCVTPAPGNVKTLQGTR